VNLIVTLKVFSGRPDPVWIIADDAAKEFMDKVEKISTASNVKPAGIMGGLGYRGFAVRRGDETVSMFIHAGVVDPGHDSPSLIVENRDIEKWLLSTAPTEVDAAVKAHVEESLKQPVSLAAFEPVRAPARHCPPCVAADAPVYNPTMWNTPSVQPHNNCYNYANNQITNTFAQPGRAAGHMYTAFACRNVQPAAITDGLAPTANFSTHLAAGHGWYLTLVVWPGHDYHWYRQDNEGCWSHKPGATAARNYDNSGPGHLIADPKTCNRGPYTDFCTYMITRKTVHIK
jgi:hypothetical protein